MTGQDKRDPISTPHMIRGNWWRWGWVPLPGVCLVVLLLIQLLRDPQGGLLLALGMAVALTAVLSFPAFWSAMRTIVLYDDHMHATSILSATHDIAYTQIRNVKIESRVVQTRFTAVYYCLVLTEFTREKVVINMRTFRLQDLSVLVDTVATRSPRARLDANAILLRKGEFQFR